MWDLRKERKMGFITIDFETSNNSMDSACSLGIVKVHNNEIIGKKHYYIKPPTLDFNQYNVDIHGITPEIVKDKPTFPAIWDEISHLFYENIVIAHNASFDMSVLRALQDYYDLTIPNFSYACSIDISSLVCPHVKGSLPERASYFGFENINHHDALDDAICCANLVISTIQAKQVQSLGSLLAKYPQLNIYDFKKVKSPSKPKAPSNNYYKYGHKIKLSEIEPNVDVLDPAHYFYGKSIVVTGEFEKITRREAFQKIVDSGGIIRTSVSRKTNVLIVGTQDNSIVGDDGMSNKEEKAYDLISQGIEIEIIKEDQFYKIIGI